MHRPPESLYFFNSYDKFVNIYYRLEFNCIAKYEYLKFYFLEHNHYGITKQVPYNIFWAEQITRVLSSKLCTE